MTPHTKKVSDFTAETRLTNPGSVLFEVSKAPQARTTARHHLKVCEIVQNDQTNAYKFAGNAYHGNAMARWPGPRNTQIKNSSVRWPGPGVLELHTECL